MEANKLIQSQSMAFLFVLTFTSLLYSVIPHRNNSTDNGLETYIVHLAPPPEGQVEDLNNWYNTFLPEINLNNDDSDEKPRMVHIYRNALTGFAAKLSAEEAKAMENLDGFLFARPQRVLSLQTTHSPNFLGLHQNVGLWKDSNYGKGIIIGLLDTGITPFHPSFNDHGMPPPPAKWKGKCEFNSTGACNNKLIGARNFLYGGGIGHVPPIDEGGHGTHTASTAAGNFVRDANVFGNANGTAAGIAPLAHVAMYKVCNELGCTESDMLAALDAAIEEGVDVISISIGGHSVPFYRDSLAIGTFTAIKKGIFVSLAAGNSGPLKSTLSNEAPWMLTVGASTIDRKLMSTVSLGNKELFKGETLIQHKDFGKTFLPIVFPHKNEWSASCYSPEFLGVNVKGKIVLCERGGGVGRVEKGQVVKDAGGVAMILMNDKANGESTMADPHVLPAIHVSFNVGEAIKAYINSTTSPIAKILFNGTVIGDVSAPQVASFSSRGPNLASPGILKPDIIGPGVSILAAWHTSVENKTDTKQDFNIISGTSMACPHLAGIATLLKSAHPDWSPAAIKSAIMTTADLVSLNKKPITDERELKAGLFAIGAGHPNPSKATNPGLIYDIQPDDYIPYLCGLGYLEEYVGVIVGKNVSCSNASSIPEAELNYPSFVIELGSKARTYTRTLTNVGEANSSYIVKIIPPQGVKIDVKPSFLNFTTINQKLSYEVTFKRGTVGLEELVEGYLIWTSDKHSVRSSIFVELID